MGFAFLIKKTRAVHEEIIYKKIAKFCLSKFENHILIKIFSLLSIDILITTSKTYVCKYKTEETHFS